jgi:hypothetical protein
MTKKYVDDPSLDFETRFKQLLEHHIEETEELVVKLSTARQKVDRLRNEVGYWKDELNYCRTHSDKY